MTQEEKAKAYDEALNIAKETYETQPVYRAWLEKMFPELRESEDERLRKLLVRQVHRNIEDETNDLNGSVYDGIKGHDPDLEESIEDWKKCLSWLEKQKEQKPAEWNAEDEKNLKHCIEIVRSWEIDYDHANPHYSNWLKSLRPQPHWKPSEQEKGALRTAIRILTDEWSFPRTAAQLQNILNAFEGKASRKEWKPSREQMEALYNTYYTCSVGATYRDILESLYEQLQRL